MNFLVPFITGLVLGGVVWQLDRRNLGVGFGLGRLGRRATAPQAESSETVSEASTESASPAADTVTTPVIGRLEDIRGIGPRTADQLRAAGIETCADLAALSPEQVLEILSHGSSAQGRSISAQNAQDWIEQARSMLDETA